jgi:hypothetical protein
MDFPCDISISMCTITPNGSSLYFSPVYLSPFLMVGSPGLRILYSFLYREYIGHIHLLSFLLLPSSSLV